MSIEQAIELAIRISTLLCWRLPAHRANRSFKPKEAHDAQAATRPFRDNPFRHARERRSSSGRKGSRLHDDGRSGRQGIQAASRRATQERTGGPLFLPQGFHERLHAEAHAFSEAISDFKKAGAQVIGMSADDLPVLKKFSVEECRNAFPVATATPATQKAYDVAWAEARPDDRTSYVIERTARSFSSTPTSNWSEHVSKTLAAVKALKR